MTIDDATMTAVVMTIDAAAIAAQRRSPLGTARCGTEMSGMVNASTSTTFDITQSLAPASLRFLNAGTTVGLIEVGDSFAIAYTKLVHAATICSDWTSDVTAYSIDGVLAIGDNASPAGTDEFTLAAACKRTGSKQLAGCRAMLFVELDGQERSVRAELKDVAQLVSAQRPTFVNRAFGAAAVESLWGLRREFSYALRDTGLTKLNEDITVPRGRLEELFKFAARLQQRHRLPVACFGHAGDGNKVACNGVE